MVLGAMSCGPVRDRAGFFEKILPKNAENG